MGTSAATARNERFVSQTIRDLSWWRRPILTSTERAPVFKAAQNAKDAFIRMNDQSVLPVGEVLLEALGGNFRDELVREYGATVTHLPLSRLSKTGPEDPKENLIDRFLTDHPGRKWEYLQIEMDYGNFLRNKWDGKMNEHNHFAQRIFYNIGHKIPATGQNLLADPMIGQDSIVLRIFPAPFLLGLATYLFGDRAVKMQLTAEPSSRREMREFIEVDTRPFCLSVKRRNAHTLRRLHPYVFTLHDLYHILVLCRFGPETRAHLRIIHNLINDLPKGAFRRRQNKEKALQVALEGYDPQSYKTVFEEIFINLADAAAKDVLRQKLYCQFRNRRGGKEILDAFDEARRDAV